MPKDINDADKDEFQDLNEGDLSAQDTGANQASGDDKAFLSSIETKFTMAHRLISNIKEELSNLERLLNSQAEPIDLEEMMRKTVNDEGDLVHQANEGKITEGVFDGQNMIGSDGKLYMVPPNYASKSKLVEGDIMKLTIQPNGSFLYKQIGPIERQRVMGVLSRDEITNDWKVVADGKKYAILTASVTYFKGQNGDDVVILVPKNAPSKWAAVENIIRRD